MGVPEHAPRGVTDTVLFTFELTLGSAIPGFITKQDRMRCRNPRSEWNDRLVELDLA
ncbi:hypothetical protein CALCODRAFT_505098 [Calocera cornea HHB12733]|uniref:Uncharacterized protein n=1 Tax=Calocera cornea HHB12733 TaxID=1353952 RepID=A0A165C0Q8_9BASI|nr:hypothetical protein CALCODRAFT_505098 [Calocera cornea HHB12733]